MLGTPWPAAGIAATGAQKRQSRGRAGFALACGDRRASQPLPAFPRVPSLAAGLCAQTSRAWLSPGHPLLATEPAHRHPAPGSGTVPEELLQKRWALPSTPQVRQWPGMFLRWGRPALVLPEAKGPADGLQQRERVCRQQPRWLKKPNRTGTVVPGNITATNSTSCSPKTASEERRQDRHKPKS